MMIHLYSVVHYNRLGFEPGRVNLINYSYYQLLSFEARVAFVVEIIVHNKICSN